MRFPFVALILVSFMFVDVKAGCSGGVSRCNWTPWKSWSECSRTCGGGTRYRHRHYCCKASLAGDIKACLENCVRSMSYYFSHNSETQSCNTWCYNNGKMDRFISCTCSDPVYGTCCEKRKLIKRFIS